MSYFCTQKTISIVQSSSEHSRIKTKKHNVAWGVELLLPPWVAFLIVFNKMKIKFKTKYLKKCLTNRKTCLKEFGNLTDTIKRKRDSIQSVTSCQELFQISGHLHELRHHAKGVYGLTIKHPYRLLLTIDPGTVTVLGIIDYHNKPSRIIQFSNYNN